MLPLPDIDSGDATIRWVAGIVGVGLFLWRGFWSAKKQVRTDHAEAEVALGYANLINTMQRQLDAHERDIGGLREQLLEAARERQELISENRALRTRVAELARKRGRDGGSTIP